MDATMTARIRLLPEGSWINTYAIRLVMVVMAVGPFLVTITAPIFLWSNLLVAILAILGMAVVFLPIAFSVTGGLHRIFTHACCKADPRLKFVLAVLSALALQGPVSLWVGDHHLHHTYSDTEHDLHSPNAGFKKNLWGSIHGFWHAHWGWLFKARHADPEAWAHNLYHDPVLERLSKIYWLFVWISLLGPLLGGVDCFLWFGLTRIFLVHHVTWLVNSAGHKDSLGQKYFNTGDHSRYIGNGVLGIIFSGLTLGELGHDPHHMWEWSARHSKYDLTYWVLQRLEQVGLVSDLRLPTEADIQRNLLPGVTHGPW